MTNEEIKAAAVEDVAGILEKLDASVGPGKPVGICGAGPTMACLTASGAIFILGRESDESNSPMQWDLLEAPTAEDMKRTLK